MTLENLEINGPKAHSDEQVLLGERDSRFGGTEDGQQAKLHLQREQVPAAMTSATAVEVGAKIQ